MSDAKHTKGPWETSTGIIPSLDKRAIAVCRADMKEGEKGTAVCVVAWESDANEKDLANARLIAAAPDMLAALELYDRLMTEVWGSPNVLSDDHGDALQVWPAVRASILKAKGEA
jgi:hypothetical protein